jgi:hypothetical protein
MLHDFTKEILRDQPEDILEYGLQFFQAMDEVSDSAICLISADSRGSIKLLE